MAFELSDLTCESLPGEGTVRPNELNIVDGFSLAEFTRSLEESQSVVLSRLVDTFDVCQSGVGLSALLYTINSDLKALGQIFHAPCWASRLADLHHFLSGVAQANPVRDMATLSTQPKSPLRDFLSPIKLKIPFNQRQALQAARALISLGLMSGRVHLSVGMAEETRSWLQGKCPIRNLEEISSLTLHGMRSKAPVDSGTGRLLTFLIDTIDGVLQDPFDLEKKGTQYVMPSSGTRNNEKQDESENESVEPAEQDPLKGFLAQAKSASPRIFSGVSNIYSGLNGFELEATTNALLMHWDKDREACIAALLTLFTRVMPTQFDKIPLSADKGVGIFIDLAAGLFNWNLDEVVASNRHKKPFIRKSADRFARIPLPRELAMELQARAANKPGCRALDDLMETTGKPLVKRTKKFLRTISGSSHRSSLTRLSQTWARYVLSICSDEVYSSAIGVDFTVGTSANFNYILLRGHYVTKTVCDAYKRIGLSGEILTQSIQDVGSLRLPNLSHVELAIQHALQEAATAVRGLPRRTSTRQLKSSHNVFVTRLYAVLKLLLAGRALEEETITRSRIDPVSGLAIQTDKRVSPGLSRRLARLPPSMLKWMKCYFSWLKLLTYRLLGEEPQIARGILTLLKPTLSGDKHPLFFRFGERGNVIPLGSSDIASLFLEQGIEVNAGRHITDSILRDRGIESAAVLGWMGRGNPGQLLCSGWSTVVPFRYLERCSGVIEEWLQTLALPDAPALSPRTPKVRTDSDLPQYQPKLLLTPPQWDQENIVSSAEECFIEDESVFLASFFPEFMRAWRRHKPPTGWAGVLLSLVLEDWVLHEDELRAAILELKQGIVFQQGEKFFVDCRVDSLGIRRVWLSPITIRLLFRLRKQDTPPTSNTFDDPAISRFVVSAVSEAQGRGIRFIQDCVRAHAAIHAPGVLHYWMSGQIFARTTRPEAVARSMLGACEWPSYQERQKTRRRQHFTGLKAALDRATEYLNEGGSHCTALRKLHADLEQIITFFSPDSEEALVAGYVSYLSVTLENVSTLERYLSACLPLLKNISRSSMESGLDAIEWRAVVAASFPSMEASVESAPERAAVNHCLKWLGVDYRIYRRVAPPPSVFRYADTLSEREGVTALDLLRTKKLVPGDVWHKAVVALSLMLEQPLRWQEVAYLRICDVSLEAPQAHIVITRESGADLKSDNAPRVLPINDKLLLAELKYLIAARKVRYPEDPFVPIFGDDNERLGRKCIDEVHQHIVDALWHATGSDAIRVHDTRHYVVSRTIAKMLDPALDGSLDTFLHQRQALFSLSAFAGHCDPSVTLTNYASGFDLLRRKWATAINTGNEFAPSFAFLESITGVPAATHRKRLSRGRLGFDPFEGFDLSATLITGAKSRRLSTLVAQGLKRIGWPSELEVGMDLTSSSIYIGLRLLTDSIEVATSTARLSEADAAKLEAKLNSINRQRKITLSAAPSLQRERFLQIASSSGLPTSMLATMKTYLPRIKLERLIGLVGEPLAFADPTDACDFSVWISPWKADGIIAELVFKSCGRSAIDDRYKQTIRDAGFKARLIKARHFPRGISASLRFAYSSGKGRGRASRYLQFWVTICMLTLRILFMEDGK